MRRNDVLSQLGKDIMQTRFNISKEFIGEDVSKRIASAKKMQRYVRTEPLVVTQVHPTIIKVRASHPNLTTVAYELHAIQKTWRASHQNKIAPIGKRTGTNVTRTKG